MCPKETLPSSELPTMEAISRGRHEGRPGAAATARPGCGELNPKGSPPRPAVAGASPRAFDV